MTFLAFLKLIPAPAGLTAISNISAAAIIASQAQANQQITLNLLPLIFDSILFYFASMAVNDCFDYQEDLKERPSRPIPNGDISLTTAWSIGFMMMLAAAVLAFLHSTTSGYIGLALGSAIILYNGFIKQGLFGSLCMASCRYLNWLLGASFVAITCNSWFFALPIFFYIVGLTFLSKQETHGKNKNSVFFCAFMVKLTALSALYLVVEKFQLTEQETFVSYGLLLIWGAFLATKLITLFNNFIPKKIQQLIGWMVIGVIPLDALMVALSGQYLFALAILALLPPCRLLNKYLYVT